jgi:hypothetical protein
MGIQHLASHLNGEEFLLIHRKALYSKIKALIETHESSQLSNWFVKDGWNKTGSDSYFMKDRIGISILLSSITEITSMEAFAKHLAFYISNHIDVGIEILPIESMQALMSSGIACHEGEFYNVIRQGRGIPAVPLVIIGVAP